jgi:hypothetical protein
MYLSKFRESLGRVLGCRWDRYSLRMSFQTAYDLRGGAKAEEESVPDNQALRVCSFSWKILIFVLCCSYISPN